MSRGRWGARGGTGGWIAGLAGVAVALGALGLAFGVGGAVGVGGAAGSGELAVAGGNAASPASIDWPSTPQRPVSSSFPRPGARQDARRDASGPPYDGRFTFLRLRFDVAGGMRSGFFGRGGREPLWAHDMPRAERNFARILDETTLISPYTGGGRVLDLDDPDLFMYPVAYIVEVGGWRPSESEVANLRQYLLKGGFLIVDDFRGNDIYRLLDTMERVLPDHTVVEIPDDHEIFDSFFRIDDPGALIPPTFRQYVPMYLGIFEDDDPSKRLVAVINYNNDIGDYWEYSDYGYHPIDLANEAYKFGVNYVVYALTH